MNKNILIWTDIHLCVDIKLHYNKVILATVNYFFFFLQISSSGALMINYGKIKTARFIISYDAFALMLVLTGGRTCPVPVE